MIKDLIKEVSKTKWELTDDFTVYLHHRKIEMLSNDILQKCIISIGIPEMTASEFDEILGGERRIGIKMFENFRFSIRFRDIDGAELRKRFLNVFSTQQYLYPEDCSFDIMVKDQSEREIFSCAEALITNVSSLEFNNNSTSIAEFDVQFISNNYKDDSMPVFGSSDFSNVIDDL